MSLGKRHVGRRVAGVGVGVALMVLGLEAPAFAAPAVTSFTPSTGPEDCVIALTGTGFLDVPQAQQDVVFLNSVTGDPDDNIILDGGGAGVDFFARISSTEMWVQIPDGTVDLGANDELALGVGYNIRVDGGGTGTASTTTFTRVDETLGAGGCAPTITSIAPTCGNTDTTVVITGTNLIAPGLSGGVVKFAPYPASPATGAKHSVPDVDTTTSLSVVVPSGSSDGKIQVTTFSTTGGTAFSPTVFDISDACAPVTGNQHARSVSFKIKSTGKASGKVSSTEDPAFTDCVAAVPVKIQRKTSSGWKTVGKTTTTDTGSYSKKVKNPKGKQKFRALAPKVSLGDPVTDVCVKAKSAVRKV
jgi:IPT/TIG domain